MLSTSHPPPPPSQVEIYGVDDNTELKQLTYSNVLENIRYRFNLASGGQAVTVRHPKHQRSHSHKPERTPFAHAFQRSATGPNDIAEPPLYGKASHLRGEASHLRGEASDLRGEASHLRGEASHLRGDSGHLRGEAGHFRGVSSHLRGRGDFSRPSEYQPTDENVYSSSNAQRKEEDLAKIYTYAGWVLFAVNPYSPCTEIYTDAWCEKYYRRSIKSVPPHPFATAAAAFFRLISEQKSQFILISGESGGGKTECSKYILKYLTWVTRKQRRMNGCRQSLDGRPSDLAESLSSLLVSSQMILEYFGNARTSRNSNSSRFGKLFQVFYDPRGQYLLRSKLQTYLLAKSRVTQVPDNEQNYHVFYSLITSPALWTGRVEGETYEVSLDEIVRFWSPFLGRQTQHRSSYYDPGGRFALENLTEALEQFGIHAHIQQQIFSILYSILLIGNLHFDEKDEKAIITTPEICDRILKLWGVTDVDCSTLELLLTSKQIRETRANLNVGQARQMSYSLAKGIYEALFDFIVGLIRRKLEEAEDSLQTLSIATDECVGVLDLFGFENMETESRNGFEQLCINFANEQLHCHFMKEMIERERDIYQEEGLTKHQNLFSKVDIRTPALALLLGDKPNHIGIFGTLEEVSRMVPQDKDAVFCKRVNQIISQTKSHIISPTKRRRAAEATLSRFTVAHFAESVEYTAAGFVEKNHDYLSIELRDFLSGLEGSLISRVFENPDRKAVSKSLSQVFIKEMGGLTNTLEQTSCFFIKCLKPNDNQAEWRFDVDRVMSQLVTGGIGPVLELMSIGYPCRISYDTLWERLNGDLLVASNRCSQLSRLSRSDFAELMMAYLGVPSDSYYLGPSRIFFRFGVLDRVETLMSSIESGSDLMGSMRAFWTSVRVFRIFSAAYAIVLLRNKLHRMRHQRVCKELKQYYENVWVPRLLNKNAKKIQTFVRQRRPRFEFLRLRRSVIKIQHAWIRHKITERLSQLIDQQVNEQRLKHHLRTIEAVLVANYLHRQKQFLAARTIQAWWRGIYTREQIKLMCQQQKEAAARTIWGHWQSYKARREASLHARRDPGRRQDIAVRNRNEGSRRDSPVKEEVPRASGFGAGLKSSLARLRASISSRRTPETVPRSPVARSPFPSAKSPLHYKSAVSRRRLDPYHSIEFDQTIEFWEIKTNPAASELDTARRRRSLFAERPTQRAEPPEILRRSLIQHAQQAPVVCPAAPKPPVLEKRLSQGFARNKSPVLGSSAEVTPIGNTRSRRRAIGGSIPYHTEEESVDHPITHELTADHPMDGLSINDHSNKQAVERTPNDPPMALAEPTEKRKSPRRSSLLFSCHPSVNVRKQPERKVSGPLVTEGARDNHMGVSSSRLRIGSTDFTSGAATVGSQQDPVEAMDPMARVRGVEPDSSPLTLKSEEENRPVMGSVLHGCRMSVRAWRLDVDGPDGMTPPKQVSTTASDDHFDLLNEWKQRPTISEGTEDDQEATPLFGRPCSKQRATPLKRTGPVMGTPLCKPVVAEKRRVPVLTTRPFKSRLPKGPTSTGVRVIKIPK